MAKRTQCDKCGKTAGVGSYRIVGPVSTVDVDLCEADSGPIRYLMGLGQLSTATGTATGPRIFDFLPVETPAGGLQTQDGAADADSKGPHGDGGGLDGLFSDPD